MNQRIYFYAAVCAAIVMCVELLASAQSVDTPQNRMRPIGSSSAVDQYRSPRNGGATTRVTASRRTTVQNATARQAAAASRPMIQQVSTAANTTLRPPDSPSLDSSARQTVMLQASGIGAPELPSQNYALPPGAPSAGAGLTPTPALQNPPATNPLPSNPPVYSPAPAAGSSVLVPGASDLAPIAQPQLNNGFATIDNCNCISAPGTYSAASGFGCGVDPCGYVTPVTYAAPPSYVAPPAQIEPQVVLPGAVAPLAAPQPAGSAPVPSLITLGQQTLPVEVGQGLWGQPVAYVPGQGFRNWIRYFFP